MRPGAYVMVHLVPVCGIIAGIGRAGRPAKHRTKMSTKDQQLSEAGTTGQTTGTKGDGTVAAKYDQNNCPQGWDYVNYKDQPGGGFRCPNCGAVEDGSDVDGHSC
jgi:hypothetical protein